MSAWTKLRNLPEFEPFREDKKPAPWLFVHTRKKGTSYRVDYRKDGVNIQKVIRGDIKTWKDASRLGDRIIYAAKYEPDKKSPDLILCSEIAETIVESKHTKAPATFAQTETFFRVHIIPFLEEHCPYARDLRPETWEKYKRLKRQTNPKIALFNHWKFMNMLRKRVREMGLIPEFRFDFDEKSEDNRREGLIVSDEDLSKMLTHANSEWRDKIILGRKTGMRPGEVRCLKFDRVGFERRTICLKPIDTKTREARTFLVESEEVWKILNRRTKSAAEMGTQYLYFSPTNPSNPTWRSTKSWKRLLKRAGVNEEYHPNDLRHSFITEMIRKGMALSSIADYVGNSVLEIERTYKHMQLEDTRLIAQTAAQSSQTTNQ